MPVLLQSIYMHNNIIKSGAHHVCMHWGWPSLYTVFPRNLAAARFYFKTLFGAATIWGRLHFEGGVYRDQYTRAYTTPIISLLYARIMHIHIRINVVDPLPCREISRAVFIGMNWQKRGEILRAAGFRGTARFRGNTVYWRHIQSSSNSTMQSCITHCIGIIIIIITY